MFSVGLSSGHLAGRDVRSSAVASLDAITSVYPEQRQTVVDTLVSAAASDNPNVQLSVARTLGAIKFGDAAQSKTAVEALVRLAFSGHSRRSIDFDFQVGPSVALALGAINTNDPEQRKIVVETLVRLADSDDYEARQSAAAALGAIAQRHPEQRKIAIETLVKLAGKSSLEESAADALFAIGPLGVDQVAHLLVHLDQDSALATPAWRAVGWAFNGSLPMSNDGAILMTFAGRPASIPIERMPTDPTSAARVLSAFAKSWPEMQESKALQAEIAQQTVAIVGAACPAAARSAGSAVEVAAERVAQEWNQTLGWLRGLVGGQDDLRCWQSDAFGNRRSWPTRTRTSEISSTMNSPGPR
jgi:HEAT repeat protein